VGSAISDATSSRVRSGRSGSSGAPSASSRTRPTLTSASESTTWAASSRRPASSRSPSWVRSTIKAPSGLAATFDRSWAFVTNMVDAAPRSAVDGPASSSSIARAACARAGEPGR
jgi:hypothetical protein